jgi:hypothetical protein
VSSLGPERTGGLQLALDAPADHPAWPALTDEQRRCINEVWDETVVPALEAADAQAQAWEARAVAAADAWDAERYRLEQRHRRELELAVLWASRSCA